MIQSGQCLQLILEGLECSLQISWLHKALKLSWDGLNTPVRAGYLL